MSVELTVPGALVWKDDVPVITFGTIDSDLMSEPFITNKLATMRVTGLRSLDAMDVADDGGDLGLAGAIFHMSRCGSTLLCRQFDQLERVAALSEPFVFQHLLEGPPASPDTTRRRLRALTILWRDALAPVADRFVMKWPLLGAHHATTISDALPGTRLLFLHREPAEILMSIQQDWLGGIRHVRPRHVDADELPNDPYQIFAAVIATACRRIAEVERVRTLDYRRLPEATADLVAPFFGLTASARMMEAAQFDAKNQDLVFTGDSEAKQAALGPDLRELADTVIAPALDATLCALRPLSAAGGQADESGR